MSYIYMPVKVYEEADAVLHHAEEIQKLAEKGRLVRLDRITEEEVPLKSLLVTGRHSAKACGAYDDVVKVLEEQGISFSLFDRVEENPSVETIMEARDFGLSEGCDLVIGIGGGSPLDAAKAISLMMYHEKEGREYLFDKNADSTAYPLVLIPTTCGTGSEVTGISVLTVSEQETKQSSPHRIYADLALIDGKYLVSASDRVLCNTAMDALAHMMESGTSRKSTDLSYAYVKEGLRWWKKGLPCLLALPNDESLDQEVRRSLMIASMYAGISIAHTGTTLPHGLSYSLTYKLHMEHGKAVSYYLAGYLKHCDTARVNEMLELAGIKDLDDLRRIYVSLCKPEAVPEENLLTAVNELAAKPEKLRAAAIDADREMLLDIAKDMGAYLNR
ncbi:MAG: iron-containing alcohol dehydrogenase [Lachnospiraceae bacterium]|nr:iron-containing alcohol dehydrogenase [Lachnospiraceae bacterium]